MLFVGWIWGYNGLSRACLPLFQFGLCRQTQLHYTPSKAYCPVSVPGTPGIDATKHLPKNAYLRNRTSTSTVLISKVI